MKPTSFKRRNGYLVLGGIGLISAAGYLGLSFRLPFGQWDRPGAGVFPVIAGITLLGGSLAALWEGWQLEKAERVDFPAGADRTRVLSLLGSLFGYFLLLPWLGQISSSTLFCILMIRVLSDLGWARVVAYSLVMSMLLYSVFILLLKVPMPRGMLAF